MADAGHADAFRFTTAASVDHLEGLFEGLISAAGPRPPHRACTAA
jgi:hypothetical protein